MAGTFPGVCGTQQQDVNGNAMKLCQLNVYVGGTTTPAAVFQDITLLLPAANPLIGDLSGRLPLFFVNDGVYHVRLTDQNGDITNGGFDYPQIPSIGPSGGGGGGTPVDPTTVFSTGDYKYRPSDEALAGWVRLNGTTIGDAISGASGRANNDTSALFQYAWNNFSDALCPVVGGRGGSAAADFAANKQITVLDLRDTVCGGLDTMGNAAKNGLTGVPIVTGSVIIGGSIVGEILHTQLQAELPNVILNTAIAAGQGIHSHTYLKASAGGGVPINLAAGSGGDPAALTGTSTLPAMTGTTPLGGAGTAFNIVQRMVLGTHFWKL